MQLNELQQQAIEHIKSNNESINKDILKISLFLLGAIFAYLNQNEGDNDKIFVTIIIFVIIINIILIIYDYYIEINNKITLLTDVSLLKEWEKQTEKLREYTINIEINKRRNKVNKSEKDYSELLNQDKWNKKLRKLRLTLFVLSLILTIIYFMIELVWY